MDKGQLPAEKLMNPESNEDNGGSNDDVEILPLHDNVSIQHNIAVSQAAKSTNRGKDIADKKPDVKTASELTDPEELLGSVTTYNCHGTRTSARVIQKMRQDQQTRPNTPPPSERDLGRKDERSANQKTPSQVRANRPTWSNVERNHFFDALNEFGKDFEAIGSFINTKLKRRSPATDISFKSKDQVRQHYYQTYHKICKYIRFSEEVRKPVQELYALINYGEMRRKLQFVTDKHFMKLRNLIYHGHITVRCKGKNIRIKTPSCKALRRLNLLDDTLEDIRLPSKIEVTISPANMEAFGRVQSIAQNPRCRATVPLHKKLVNFIKTFQHKWRNMDIRMAEEAKLMPTLDTGTFANDFHVQEGKMCFLPKPGVAIHRPLLSITEYLSSVNICLTAYEERMGIKVKGEHLNSDRCPSISVNSSITNAQTSNNNSSNISTAYKRIRTESGSDKRSPEQMKKVKPVDNSCDNSADDTQLLNHSFQIAKNESSSDELSDELQELLCDSNEITINKEYPATPEYHNPPPLPPPPPLSATETLHTTCASQLNTAVRSRRSMGGKTPRAVFKPLLNDDVIQRIRSGWTTSTAGDITLGDLYVVFGQDSKLHLDYYWTPLETDSKHFSKAESQSLSNLPKQNLLTTSKQAPNFSSTPGDDETLHKSVQTSDLSNRLKQLLLIANLSEQMRRRPCTCDRINAAKVKFERDLTSRTFIANKTPTNNGTVIAAVQDKNSPVFRQPMVPVRRTSIDPVKQLTTLTRQKMSRPVLVQRLLLPSNGSANANTQHGGSAMPALTNDANTTMPSSMLTANSKEEVPWTLADSCDTQTTTAVEITNTTVTATTTTTTTISTTTTTTATATNHNSQQQIACNNPTFLDTLQLAEYEELPQSSSSSQYQQQFENFEQLNDGSKAVTLTTGIPSVDSAFDETSSTSFLNGLTPMHLLRETSSNAKWLEENINDFSLTSLLGHLDEINSNRDMLDASSNLSVISESSVDYMHKFQEIKALLQNQEKD